MTIRGDMAITRGFAGRGSTARDPRLPPGQYDAGDSWPVPHAEVTPSIELRGWACTVDGLVKTPTTWTWSEIRELPASRHEGAIHCITTWSEFGMTFDGVSVDTLLARPGPTAGAPPVLLEEREMGIRTDAAGRRPARLLGAQRIPRPGRPWLEQRYQGDLRWRRTTATGPDDYAYLYAVDVGRDGGAVTADAAHIVSDETNGNQTNPAADLRISTAHVD